MTAPVRRVAALYDIHSNLPALDAVLADVRTAGVDLFVIGGDIVPGPMPHETIGRLLALDLPTRFIRGNGEDDIVALARGGEPAAPQHYRESMRWVAAQVGGDYASELAAWPLTVSIDVQGLGSVLFCHATPRSNTEIFTARTAEDLLVPIFDGAGAGVVVCGHTHMQFDRTIGRTRVVNAGSVGMPFGAPGAYWALIGGGNAIEPQCTTYDLVRAAEAIRSSADPLAAEFADHNVLAPRSADEMLALFASGEVGTRR